MQTFSQFALPGTILASALGAVVLCLVLLFYGVKTEPDDEHAPGRRLLLIRLGHAAAAACFATALMLGTVALIDQRRAAAAGSIAQPTEDTRRLAARVSELEQRLAAAEPRVSETATAPAPSVPAPSVVEATPARAASHRTIASTAVRPRKTAVTMSKPASDEFGTRARHDWDEVKRGFREVGRDIHSGFVDLG